MTSSRLQDEIEHSFGDGPAARPVDAHVAAGRRALRRRRVGVASLAVVAAVGAGWAVTGPQDSGGTSGEVATDPTATPTPTPMTTPVPAGAPWTDEDGPVRYRDGVLEVRPGVVVHERIDDPYADRPSRASAALDVTYRGERQWVIAELMGAGDDDFSVGTADPSNGWASFADWVADEVDANGAGDDGWPVSLEQDQQGRVVATPGTTVLDRTDDPRLGASFAAPRQPTGAALVVAAEDGKRYFLVWRVLDGGLNVITTPATRKLGGTFEEMLEHARAQYAGGEGLL
ncbi:hypothetical protein [Nocardioides lijunqiniae]|uniref:hypothetical protein n=1 Tax=Nocardioides lijunqiniae TaxID=2760832 RepID=UPI0018787606|nr:hypothetical protein [Nocardioides lijunqiniae]